LWLHSLKVAQLLRSAACLHTNQSRSYLNHLVYSDICSEHHCSFIFGRSVFLFLTPKPVSWFVLSCRCWYNKLKQTTTVAYHVTCFVLSKSRPLLDSALQWTYAGPIDRAVYGVGLRPLACWDCGFESRRGSCVASLSQGRTAAAQCGLFTHKSVPVVFEPPCILTDPNNVV